MIKHLVRSLSRTGLPSLLAGLILMAWVPVSQAASAIEQLEEFVQTVQTSQGNFTQQQLDESGQKAGQMQQGHFAFERPGKFRWETTQPHEQHIVSNGRVLLQYDPDLAQVIERDIDESVGASPAAILFGSEPLSESFELSLRPDAQSMQWLRARPLTPDAGFAHVDIGFKRTVPRQIILHDAFGQTTRIELTEVKTNPELSPDVFQLQIPDDVDRVKM